jgi:hypothetical protein
MIGEPIIVTPALVAETRAFLREKGQLQPCGHEGVVLWLGAVSGRAVETIVIPKQETGFNYFDVSLVERKRLAHALAGTGQIVLAQVHSHPHEAWHSPVDDERALPRRVGSLSLVVPDHGRRPGLQDGAAMFVLDPDGQWLRGSLDLLMIRAPSDE